MTWRANLLSPTLYSYVCGGFKTLHPRFPPKIDALLPWFLFRDGIVEDQYTCSGHCLQLEFFTGVCNLDDKIYCIGGWNGQVGIRQCDVLDPDIGKWISIAPLQTGMTTFCNFHLYICNFFMF